MYDNENEGNILFSLASANSEEASLPRVKASYTFLGSDKQPVFRRDIQCERGARLAFAEVSRSEIKKKALFVDGALTIRVQIEIPSSDAGCGSSDPEGMDMSALLKDGRHRDVTLFCGGREFHCHRAILSARSKVLEEMFGSEGGQSACRVEVPEMEPKTLEAVLRFVYTGKLEVPPLPAVAAAAAAVQKEEEEEDSEEEEEEEQEIKEKDTQRKEEAILNTGTEEEWIQLYAAAHRLVVQGLVDLSLEQLCQSFGPDGFIPRLLLAERYEIPKLKAACKGFLMVDPARRRREVKGLPAFAALSPEDTRLVLGFLGDDDGKAQRRASRSGKKRKREKEEEGAGGEGEGHEGKAGGAASSSRGRTRSSAKAKRPRQ